MAENKPCSKTCWKVFEWIVQILLWIFIALFILTLDQTPIYLFFMINMIVFYIIYIVVNLICPTFSYLKNVKNSMTIHEIMSRHFSTAPDLTTTVRCFHYETRTHTSRDSKGRSHTRTSRVKVTKYTETKKFYYYSWRDTSGLFLLDSHKVIRSHLKKYIQLDLNLKVDFADDISRVDHQRQMDDLYITNKWRDTHCVVDDNRTLSGLENFNLVKIADGHPFGIHLCVYLIFVFLIPIVELYKIYFNLFCIEQPFEVKKVISTRFDINTNEHAGRWDNHIPKLSIFNQPQVNFNEAPPITKDFNPVLPTFEELDFAKNFQHKPSQSEDLYVPYFNINEPGNNMPSQTNQMMTNFSEPTDRSHDHINVNVSNNLQDKLIK